MYRKNPKTLPRTLRRLEELEKEHRFSKQVLIDVRIKYFREKVCITCNSCKRRSKLHRWDFVRTFKRVWHRHIGVGELKGMSTLEPDETQFCLITCPHCATRQDVGLSLESAYLVLAIEDYRLSPTVLFANYALRLPTP